MTYKTLALSLFVFLTIQHIQSQEITVEKIWKKYEFSGAGVSGFKSMKDGFHYTKLTKAEGKQSITKHEMTKSADQSEVLISSDKLVFKKAPIVVDDYFFNDDETKVLLTTQTIGIYRYSFSAVYYLYDLKTSSIQPLDEEHQPQTLAEYSPDGLKVSFIYKNNLFVKDLNSGKVTKLTTDGKRNKIINGTTDWVYEEEFAITKAYGWSPDSKYIGFLKFNEKMSRNLILPITPNCILIYTRLNIQKQEKKTVKLQLILLPLKTVKLSILT